MVQSEVMQPKNTCTQSVPQFCFMASPLDPQSCVGWLADPWMGEWWLHQRDLCQQPRSTVSPAVVWESLPCVTSAGIAPLGIQSGSRAGGRVHRILTSCLAGETSVVLNSCLCRNRGGSGGDGFEGRDRTGWRQPIGMENAREKGWVTMMYCTPRNSLNISSLPCCVTLFQKLLLFLVAF